MSRDLDDSVWSDIRLEGTMRSPCGLYHSSLTGSPIATDEEREREYRWSSCSVLYTPLLAALCKSSPLKTNFYWVRFPMISFFFSGEWREFLPSLTRSKGEWADRVLHTDWFTGSRLGSQSPPDCEISWVGGISWCCWSAEQLRAIQQRCWNLSREQTAWNYMIMS